VSATLPTQRQRPELVCALNQDFLAGLLRGLRARGVEAVPQPDGATDPTRCCVLVHASSRPISTP
jgi:hypothetical protein